MAEEPEIEVDAAASMEATLERGLAASALGPLAQRQEGVAQMMIEDGPGWQVSKLTHMFSRDEIRLHAKAHYHAALNLALRAQDGPEGFKFPSFDGNLLKPDYRLRKSYREATMKHLESITKIFERGNDTGGSGRGLFGRRRG